MQRMQGKSVLIFGGGSVGGRTNNGLAASILYAREGAELTIVDANPRAVSDGVARVEQECRELGVPSNVVGVQGDVTDPESVSAAVDVAVGHGRGRIDVLHNNVGIARMGSPVEMSLQEWELVSRVNLTSAFLTCKYVLPHMLSQQSGVIVNIASIGGMRYIGYDYPSYAATKAGLIQFTTSLALEYAAQGLRANSISPGYIHTPMAVEQISGSYDSVEEMVEARNRLSPTGMMGEPFDVAHAALFLASDESKYINGVCLPVDGGLSQQAAAPVASTQQMLA